MEFSTLTRRVAEATGTDLAAIEAAPVKVEGAAEAHGPDVGAGGIALEARRRRWRKSASARRVAPAARWRRPGASGETPPTAPSVLAALRAQAAAAATIDVNAYVCIRDLPTLKAWIAEAREAGVVAFDAETTSPDPMQADLVGFSLAIEPGPRRLCAARAPRRRHRPARRRPAGGPDPRPRGARSAEAAARGPLGAQARPQHQVRAGRDEPARDRHRVPSTTRC